MLTITVQYPPSSSDISDSDLDVLRAFDGIIAHNTVALFISTLNPEWVVESGDHMSPLCILKIGRHEVLRRTVDELRTMTRDEFHKALIEASFNPDF